MNYFKPFNSFPPPSLLFILPKNPYSQIEWATCLCLFDEREECNEAGCKKKTEGKQVPLKKKEENADRAPERRKRKKEEEKDGVAALRPHRSRDLSRGSERSSRALQISYIASQPIKVGEKKSGLRREQRQLLSHRKLVACLYHNGEGTIGPRLFTPLPPLSPPRACTLACLIYVRERRRERNAK